MAFAETVFYLLELVGTVAFAISGAMAALERRLDVFGALFLGLTTALGGGCLRDVLLGNTPVQMFRSPDYVIAALIAALAVFLAAYFGRGTYYKKAQQIDRFNNIFDAVGLGVFTIVGVRACFPGGYGDNAFMCVFMGMLTGVGGGVLRDMMSREIPMVLRKRIYALASLLGALCYWLLFHAGVRDTVSALAGGALTFLIRILATRYRWSLPKVPPEEELKGTTL